MSLHGCVHDLERMPKFRKFEQLARKKDKSAIAYFRCISVNQNGEKFWTTRERKSQIEEGGGGINTYTAATGKYKKMIGLKCPYGVQYHQDVVWYTHRCKLN